MELVLVDAACKPKVKREDQDKIKRNDTRTTLRKNNLQIRTRIIQLCFWQIFETNNETLIIMQSNLE